MRCYYCNKQSRDYACEPCKLERAEQRRSGSVWDRHCSRVQKSITNAVKNTTFGDKLKLALK